MRSILINMESDRQYLTAEIFEKLYQHAYVLNDKQDQQFMSIIEKTLQEMNGEKIGTRTLHFSEAFLGSCSVKMK